MNINTNDYNLNYELKDGKIIFLFLNGLGGTKEYFNGFKKYTDKDLGYILVDLPGYGLSKFKKKPKNILKFHLEILNLILRKHKIQKINLVLFSLSTVYLKYLKRNNFIINKINKIFLLDPVIKKSDLEWSMKIYKMKYKNYLTYINKYKHNLESIFKFSIVNKKAKIKNLVKNIKNFDNKTLYLINKQSVKIILENKIIKILKKFNVIYLYPEYKKKKIKSTKNKIFIKKSGHYIFIENPKIIYKTFFKYGKLNTKYY